VRGRVREIVIYFKFHENRSRGLGAVGGRKSPSPIDKAQGLYNICTTVQAVIPVYLICRLFLCSCLPLFANSATGRTIVYVFKVTCYKKYK